jgi:hypothetical protein
MGTLFNHHSINNMPAKIAANAIGQTKQAGSLANVRVAIALRSYHTNNAMTFCRISSTTEGGSWHIYGI